MKRFSFRLEKVLRYRTLHKNEVKRELALRMQEQKTLEDHVTFLELEYRKHPLTVGQIISAESLHLKSDYIYRLKEDIEKTRTQIGEAKERVREVMQRYIEASKEEKALLTLKDKKITQYKDAANKEEQDFLDELTVMRASLERPLGTDKE